VRNAAAETTEVESPPRKEGRRRAPQQRCGGVEVRVQHHRYLHDEEVADRPAPARSRPRAPRRSTVSTPRGAGEAPMTAKTANPTASTSRKARSSSRNLFPFAT